jgi:hypothetical protein
MSTAEAEVHTSVRSVDTTLRNAPPKPKYSHEILSGTNLLVRDQERVITLNYVPGTKEDQDLLVEALKEVLKKAETCAKPRSN